jgi:hypothetical protein
MNKQLLLEKYIKVAVKKALKEQEEQQKKIEQSVYLTYRFPGLRKLMIDLMSPAFNYYVKDISIIAPKPTTFKVSLINNQEFNISYLGKGNFSVKIAGKKYNPIDLSELESASQNIANLLELNYAPEDGKEQSNTETPSTELAADLETEAPPTETPPTEAPPEEETPLAGA